MKNKEIKAPVFTGFYNTIAENEIDYTVESEMKYYNVSYEQLEIDYKGMFSEIGQYFIDQLENELQGEFSSLKLKFVEVDSPKYYNYRNDEIIVSISLNQQDVNKLIDLIFEYQDDFSNYLYDNFTSLSGFIPSYSSQFEDWQQETKNFKIYDDDVMLSYVLDFICIYVLELEEYNLLEDVNANGGLFSYITLKN